MAFQGLEDVNVTTLEGLMKFPLTGDFYFWGKILWGIWVIVLFNLYFSEKKRLGKGNVLSALAFSSIAIMFITFSASLVGFITEEIFITTLVLDAFFIILWWIKSD